MNVSVKTKPVVNFITSRFGPLSITEDKIIYFTQGIPGFERLKRFILIDHDADGVFKWLQAIDDPLVAFLLTDPSSHCPGFFAPLRKSDIERLGLNNAGDLVTLVMVCVTGTQVSLNLKGPVLFNASNMRAMQCIIDRDDVPSHFVIKN